MTMLQKLETEKSSVNAFNLWECHRDLGLFNKRRLTPGVPGEDWESQISNETYFLYLEGRVLEYERKTVQHWLQGLPTEPQAFMTWFEGLKETGPGQNDPLFPWLAGQASLEEMRWFISQEVAGEAGFDDLTALTQLKLPTRPKLEIARNYWDEMGRGNETKMHGPMLLRVAQEIRIDKDEPIVPESTALGNILLGLAANRRYAYHSIGALGAVELTAPGRAKLVSEGLERLGLSPTGQQYFKVHSVLDISHSLAWNQEVIFPLVEQNPKLAIPIAEGALMRLHAGARCFLRYRQELWSSET